MQHKFSEWATKCDHKLCLFVSGRWQERVRTGLGWKSRSDVLWKIEFPTQRVPFPRNPMSWLSDPLWSESTSFEMDGLWRSWNKTFSWRQILSYLHHSVKNLDNVLFQTVKFSLALYWPKMGSKRPIKTFQSFLYHWFFSTWDLPIWFVYWKYVWG